MQSLVDLWRRKPLYLGTYGNAVPAEGFLIKSLKATATTTGAWIAQYRSKLILNPQCEKCT